MTAACLNDAFNPAGTYYCDGHGRELEAPIRLAEEVVLVGLGDTAADVVLQAHKKHATQPAFVVSEVDDIGGDMSGYYSPPGLHSALILHGRLMAAGS